MSRAKTVVALSSCAILVAALSSQAQDVIGPGSTVQGDILRGEGVYLRGRGIYELYSAKGRRIDAGTEIMIQKWNKQVYDAYMRERASHIQSRKSKTVALEAARQKEMAEKELRLRTTPNDADVVNADALNALLADLSDPMILPSVWRATSVALPGKISIRSLFFRFAPKFGDKNSGTLTSNLIALGRLDPSREWPIFIPQDKVGAECRAYESTYKALLDQCEKDKLKLETVTKVDLALAALKNKVATAVPTERKFRETALKYVTDMQVATKNFDASTIFFFFYFMGYTEFYTPQTVGELLAFLRKYRLYFATAAGRPEDGEIYRDLFNLLREQKEKLGLPVLPAYLEPKPLREEDRLQGTWVLIKSVRDGKMTPGSNDPATRWLLNFDGNRYAVRNAKGWGNSGTFKVDVAKNPKTLDRSGVNGKKEFVKFNGIYDWVDDNTNLRICFSSTKRPDKVNAGPGCIIEVWSRINP